MQVFSDDDSIPPDSAIAYWHDVTYQGMLSVGSDMRISSEQIKTYMKDAGFINVQVIDMKWPISAWEREPRLKEAGAIMKQSMLGDMRGLSTKIFREFLGYSAEEMDALLVKVAQEWGREDIHGYWPL